MRYGTIGTSWITEAFIAGAAIAGGMECAAIGDAVKCGKGTYNLSTFSDLLKI